VFTDFFFLSLLLRDIALKPYNGVLWPIHRVLMSSDKGFLEGKSWWSQK